MWSAWGALHRASVDYAERGVADHYGVAGWISEIFSPLIKELCPRYAFEPYKIGGEFTSILVLSQYNDDYSHARILALFDEALAQEPN